MSRKRKEPGVPDKELRDFGAFMHVIGPSRVPTIRIYRLEPHQKQGRTHFRKQTRVDEVLLSDFLHSPSDVYVYLHEKFGVGTYLLRTVRSNGKWGPSRSVCIG